MLFELVKNSLRAVQERYMNSDKDVPPVRIIVADGEEDVTIKVLINESCNLKICKGQQNLWNFHCHLSSAVVY